MYTCVQCKLKFDTVQKLTNHLRTLCFASKDITSFGCGEDGCLRHFSGLATLRKHINKCHSNEPQRQQCQSFLMSASSMQQERSDNNIIEPLQIHCSEMQANPTQTDLRHQMGLFVSSLYGNPLIPRSNVQMVMQSLQVFVVDSLESTLRSRVLPLLNQIPSNANLIAELNQIITMLSNLVKDFSTEHRRLKYFSDQQTYIAPIQVVIGQHMEQKHTRLGLTYLPTDCTMQVIPLRKVLQLYFSVPSILKDTLEYINKLSTSTSNGICNLIQGSVWSNIARQNTTDEMLLPLVLYYDDFEVGNPLGSHAGIHKLGGVYVSCPCLPPRLISQLRHIFVLALFHSSDRVQFGNKIIFQKVIEELNYLFKYGVSVSTDIFTGIIKFRVSAITGDNLGLNSILGFVESFTANHPCRICVADRVQIQNMTTEESTLMRNASNYASMLEVEGTFNTGIKEECIWASLEGFNLFENVVVDLLHDMLEGCCKYVMSYIIAYFIKELKVIHLCTIQQRIAAFDFGPDFGSKPTTALTFEGSALKLRMSASETLTFVRYFGLLVGYYIPRENEAWKLYILLRTILERLLSHRVFNDTCEQLAGLITEFNNMYSQLSKEPLKPKFHFLIHYPTMLKKFGPICHVWTMRFEAKHSVSKKIARTSSNKVNICKTIAVKNQLQLNEFFIMKGNNTNLQHGKKTDVRHVLGLNQKFNLPTDRSVKFSVPWVKINGTQFKKSHVVTVGLSEVTLLPSFAVVNRIYIDSNEGVLFACSSLDTVGFDEHYYAYEVVTSDVPLYTSYEELLAPVPNSINVMPNLITYVTSRWCLD